MDAHVISAPSPPHHFLLQESDGLGPTKPLALEDGSEGGAGREAALEAERAELASALERLAEVQRELAQGQRSLMAGQHQLAEQQGRLVTLMSNEAEGQL